MNTVSKKCMDWLLPAVLILFLLQAVTLPFVFGMSWADGSESPSHVLTYKRGSLTWDADTDVDDDGVARFNLFSSEYDDSVKATPDEDGKVDKVAAPGTGEQAIVRLVNKVSGPITYKAVLYQIQDDPDMAVKSALSGSLTDAEDYPLPDGVEPEQVIRAVTGKIKGRQFQDFDIDWMWQYEISAEQDNIDSEIGDRASQGLDTNVEVGLYIVVVDNNSYATPESPKTGDNGVGAYLALMAITGIVLVFLLWEKRKARKCGD